MVCAAEGPCAHAVLVKASGISVSEQRAAGAVWNFCESSVECLSHHMSYTMRIKILNKAIRVMLAIKRILGPRSFGLKIVAVSLFSLRVNRCFMDFSNAVQQEIKSIHAKFANTKTASPYSNSCQTKLNIIFDFFIF